MDNSKRLSKEARIKIVQWFHEIKSVLGVQRKFKREYGTVSPAAITIRRLVGKFAESGSILDRPRSGRPRSSRSEPNIQAIKQVIEGSPLKSLRQVASESDVGCMESVRSIIRKDLGLKPYKIHELHELKDKDYKRRADFCSAILNKIEETQSFLENVLFTDESYFYLDRSVLSRNIRSWSSRNPHVYSEHPLQPEKVLVWCGLCSRKVYGPFFFDKPIDKVAYLSMLRTKLVPALRRDGVLQTVIFQQDGGGPHTANDVLKYLEQHFPDRVISWRTSSICPPRSPDLTPLDLFLGGYLKEDMKLKDLDSLEDLKNAIREGVRQVNQNKELLMRVVANCKYRLQSAILNEVTTSNIICKTLVFIIHIKLSLIMNKYVKFRCS